MTSFVGRNNFFSRLTCTLANNGDFFWLTPLYLLPLLPWKHGTFPLSEQKEFVFCLYYEYFESPGHQPIPFRLSKTTGTSLFFPWESLLLSLLHMTFIEMEPTVALQFLRSSELRMKDFPLTTV